MKKFTKKQKEALEYLILDLDELSNKPRRLFSSFIRFTEAFIEEDSQAEIIADINQWEEMYYKNVCALTLLEDSGRMCMTIRKELEVKIKAEGWRDWKEDHIYAYTEGIKDATRKMALKFNEKLIEELY